MLISKQEHFIFTKRNTVIDLKDRVNSNQKRAFPVKIAHGIRLYETKRITYFLCPEHTH